MIAALALIAVPLLQGGPLSDVGYIKGAIVDAEAAPIATTTVGMRVRIEEIPIPGPKLRAKPVADPGRADAIVRLVNVYPHGSGWRYNVEITPFVAGAIDLYDHLEPADRGDALLRGEPLLVEVGAVLPADEIEPNDIDVPQPDDVGGYRNRMIAIGALWGAVLLGLLFVGRSKPKDDGAGTEVKPLTLADRLRPLVEDARSGDLSTERRAELERLLLAHWRERRDLAEVDVAEAVARLRRDDEAGPLFRQLEEWLHRPDGPDASEVDVAALLQPYEESPGPAGAPR
ncbi:MAG: hypothetical protein AAF726_04900 [Planctomycetota bacterium]